MRRRLAVGTVTLGAVTVALAMLRAGPVESAWRAELLAGRVARAHGIYEEARRHFEAALVEARKTFDPDDPRLDVSVHELAQIEVALGKPREADSLYLGLVASRARFAGESLAVAAALNRLGDHQRAQKRYSPAETSYRQALRIQRRLLGPYGLENARTLSDLAELYWLTGRYAEALELCERGLEIRRNALGRAHRDVVSTERSCSSLRRGLGQPPKRTSKPPATVGQQLAGDGQ